MKNKACLWLHSELLILWLHSELLTMVFSSQETNIEGIDKMNEYEIEIGIAGAYYLWINTDV